VTTTIPRPQDDYDAETMRRAFDTIDQRLRALEGPAAKGYIVTTPPASLRTIDGTSGSTAQMLQLLCTLIKDLKTKGVISK
jgi:DNA-binding ferritin-like protein